MPKNAQSSTTTKQLKPKTFNHVDYHFSSLLLPIIHNIYLVHKVVKLHSMARSQGIRLFD
jgi:hypothetical protein